MKPGPWLKIVIILVCISTGNAAVWADEPEVVTEVAVQTGKISKTTLHRYVLAYGMVEPEPAMSGKPAASSKVAAPMAGLLTHIYCEEGQSVKKGDLLFALDTRSTDALIAKAEVTVEFAQKNFARKQQLNATDNVSRKLYDEAEQLLQTARKDLLNAKTQRELLQIKAPLAGIVTTIHFKAGEAVGLNTVMADLINMERLDIAIRIPSLEATDLEVGQPVDINNTSISVWNDTDVPMSQRASVIFIGAQIDPLTDTLLVRASLNHSPKLHPGQFVRVRILVEERPDRLAVPIESVVTREDVSMIAIVEDNYAKLKTVKSGLREGNLVEVTGETIQEGMTIVTRGVYGLPAESRIRVIQ